MATDQGDGGGGQRRPTAPTMLKVGTASRGPQQAAEAAGFPPGVGMHVQAPNLDIKALSFVSVEPATGILELRDRKNVPVKIRMAAKDASPYMLDVGPRGQVRTIAISDVMATELIPLAYDAVLRAQKDPIHAKHVPAATAYLEAMAKLAKMALTSSSDRPKFQTGKATETATGFTQNQKSFTGSREGVRAPPAISPTANARPALSTEALTPALPGIVVDTLALTTVTIKQGFVEMYDDQGGRVSLQQTKYTPPPQFTIEFALKGGPAQRKPVTGPMAREFCGLLQVISVDTEFTQELASAKALLLYTQALLKVP